MILDYNFSKKKQEFTISYIKENGAKALLKYNISKFKTFYETTAGRFVNWNGNRCDVMYTNSPEWCDIKTFLRELPPADLEKIAGRYNPKLYTFDIEVQVDPFEFPHPEEAKFPILTISVVNEQLNTVVLGTKQLDDTEELQHNFIEYLDTCEFYKKLELPEPKIRYLYFETEGAMLEYFLKNIVAKCPVLAGWNSIGFDWQYIVTRINNYYPDININTCSIDWSMSNHQCWDMKGNKFYLPMPNHTLIMDMMDVIDTFDIAVMPIKENMSLDYIASESPVGLHKIKYEGDLQHLYETDYPKYVFYNAIDSVLVQLIDKCFKTLNSLYAQALLIGNRIDAAMSKIAISESMFFDYFYDHGIKIVPSERFDGERGELVGAYVREPTPGKHNWVCCNDFASLYPSAIITCNLSIENYIGGLADGTFTEPQLEKYKADPNYFVSVNGNVYKNDRDYAFKEIQKSLKSRRAITKYLSKQLDATVGLDIEHALKGRKLGTKVYDTNIAEVLSGMGYTITRPADLTQYDLKELQRKLKAEITFMVGTEQALKLIMNSLYGGVSHIAFEWFNINMANDITGEGRNIIHKMEHHIPQYMQDNWLNMKDLHKKLGIKLKPVHSI